MADTTPGKPGYTPLNIYYLKSHFPRGIRRWRCFVLLLTVCISIYVLSVSCGHTSYSSYGHSTILMAISSFGHMLSPQECPDVEQLAIGHWKRWDASRITQSDIEDVNRYNILQWKRLSIPLSLEREDKKCGNVAYGPGRWISTANCNPEGATPCCYDNVCQSKSMADCQCQGCYDLRLELKAELADWVPKNKNCKVTV